MSADHLYVYRCATCRVSYTVTQRAEPGRPYRCRCYAPMPLQFAQPIETDADRALAARCPIWNGIDRTTARPPRPPDRCGTCRSELAGDVLDLSPAGKFCSQACADKGVADYEAFMERVNKVKQEKPWLWETTSK